MPGSQRVAAICREAVKTTRRDSYQDVISLQRLDRSLLSPIRHNPADISPAFLNLLWFNLGLLRTRLRKKLKVSSRRVNVDVKQSTVLSDCPPATCHRAQCTASVVRMKEEDCH